MLEDGVAGDADGEQAGGDAAVVVLEVDVDDVPAGVELFGAGPQGDPRLAAAARGVHGIDAARVEQGVAVGHGADVGHGWRVAAVEHAGEVGGFPPVPVGAVGVVGVALGPLWVPGGQVGGGVGGAVALGCEPGGGGAVVAVVAGSGEVAELRVGGLGVELGDR